MSEERRLLEEAVDKLFTAQLTQRVIDDAEAGQFAGALWAALTETGLTYALAPEQFGGSGLNWHQAGVLLQALGYHAAPVPLAETLLASWLAGQADMALPDGIVTVLDASAPNAKLSLTKSGTRWRLNGEAGAVPWASTAQAVLVGLPDDRGLILASVKTDSAKVTRGVNLAGEPRDRVSFEAAVPEAVVHTDFEPDTMTLYGALVRAGAMAGALSRALEMSTRYVGERVQFGRPLGKFQAIQQQLAELACEAAAVRRATDVAFDAADGDDPVVAIASAKVRAGDATTKGAGIAHAVHGAIGFTTEYALNRFTRRLWAWRGEFGPERDWAIRLGRLVLTGGGDALWPRLTDNA